MESRTASSMSMNVTPMPAGFPSALGSSRTQVMRPAADAVAASPGISISSVSRVPTAIRSSVSTKSPSDPRSSQRDTSSLPVALSQRIKPPLRARGSRRRSSTIGEVYRVYVTVSVWLGENVCDPVGSLPTLCAFAAARPRRREVIEALQCLSVDLFLVSASSAAHGPQVKILDFGLARLLQDQTITTYGLALGTPSFMSPEQAAGRLDDIDGRTDLFALAATGFRLRAGRRIHEADNPVEIVMKMAKVPAPRLATVAPGVSEPYARIIDRGLEFNREDRYPTATAMLKDVRSAIQQIDAGGGATRSARPPRLPAPVVGAEKRWKDPSAATIEVSDRDLLVPRGEPWRQVDESIRIPKNRSVLPWLFLVVVASVGCKLWGKKVWEVARERWAAAAPSAPTASSVAPPQDAPPVASAPSEPMVAATASQADAATGPAIIRSDPKPGAVAGQPAPSNRTPVTRHHAPARTSPAQSPKTKKHRP
jgi:hypothetical protein